MALLMLAQAALPGRIESATVDHGLRSESRAEAELVGRTCSELGVPHEILAVEVPTGNVQAQARNARYKALASWANRRGMNAVATAHHADDQAETLLMRLNRGSGLAGLAGVRRNGRIEGLHVIRPLLDWRKAELLAVCTGSGTDFALDPSNDSAQFDRVRVRKEIEQARWIDPLALSKSASHLADVATLIERMVDADWQASVSRQDDDFLYLPHAERLVAVETLVRIYRELSGEHSRAECARVHERLLSGKNASLGRVLATATKPGTAGAQWRFSMEPPRQG